MKHYWLTLTYLEDEDEDDDKTNLKPMMIWTSLAVIITYAYLKPVTINYIFHEDLSSTKSMKILGKYLEATQSPRYNGVAVYSESRTFRRFEPIWFFLSQFLFSWAIGSIGECQCEPCYEGHMICTLEIVILLLFLNQKVNNKWFFNSDYNKRV